MRRPGHRYRAPGPAYGLVDGCYSLRAPSGAYVTHVPLLGYRATASATGALRFRMQATALGRYLLYAADGRMPAVGLLGDIAPSATPGPSADWIVTKAGSDATLTSVANGRRITVNALGRLVLTTGTAASFRFVPATGCAAFPEVDVNVGGTPQPSADADGPVTRRRPRVLGGAGQENASFENLYTLGMRGIHDSNMQGPKTDAERIRTLEQIFADQRALLGAHVRPDIERIPQIFCAYKEVLSLYRQGLKVPDDVTIVSAR